MNIAKIFSQSLGVFSCAKTFLMVCRFRMDSHSNKFGICLKGSGCPFHIKIVIHSNGLGYLFEKMSSVQMACGMYLLSGGLGYLFEKIVFHSNCFGYLFEKEIVNRSSD